MARSNARCYRLLGLRGGEGIDQIRGAYRDLARQHHPDRVGGDGERFKEITAAYNQLVQCVSDRAACRTTAPNSPRGPRRRRDENRQASGAKTTDRPWTPNAKRAETPKAEKADWSTFEQFYKENLKKRQERRTSDCVKGTSKRPRQAVGSTPNSTTQQDVFAPKTAEQKSAPSTRGPAVQPNGPISERRKKTTTPTTPEMDSDFAAAWKAWCENARRFDARHGWRDVPTDTPRSENNDSEAAFESENRGGWRQWFRRGIDKITKRPSGQSKGRDINLRLPVSVGIMVEGGQQRIAVRRTIQCPSCMDSPLETCACAGSGRLDIRDEVKVSIPAATRYGTKIKVVGKGHAGLGAFTDGDLFLELEPTEMPGFRREGADIHGSCLITPEIARTGGFVTVGLPRGGVRVKVPARTCVGDRFRLRGQGLPMGADGRVGDAFLTVRVG